MNKTEVPRLLSRWERLACDGAGSTPVDADSFLLLAKETFFLLSRLDHRSVTNQIMHILVLMQEFADYCWFSVPDSGLTLWFLTSELLHGFLNGFQETGTVYPRLKLTDTTYTIDFFDFSVNTLADLQQSGSLPF